VSDKLPALMAQFVPFQRSTGGTLVPDGEIIEFDATYDLLRLSATEIRLWKPEDGKRLLQGLPGSLTHSGPWKIKVDPHAWLRSLGVPPSRFSTSNLDTLRARFEEGDFDCDIKVSGDRTRGWGGDPWLG